MIVVLVVINRQVISCLRPRLEGSQVGLQGGDNEEYAFEHGLSIPGAELLNLHQS